MTTLSTGHANNLMDASLGTAAFVATVGPLKCRLMTVNGSSTTNGTQVTGGTYAPLTVAFSLASSGSAPQNGALAFTGIVAGTIVVGVELWDSAGTPIRKQFGPVNTPYTVGADGLLNIASGGIVCSFT